MKKFKSQYCKNLNKSYIFRLNLYCCIMLLGTVCSFMFGFIVYVAGQQRPLNLPKSSDYPDNTATFPSMGWSPDAYPYKQPNNMGAQLYTREENFRADRGQLQATTNQQQSRKPEYGGIPKIQTRHINNHLQQNQQQQTSARMLLMTNDTEASPSVAQFQVQSNFCQDKLCFGLPQGCVEEAAKKQINPLEYSCQVLVTSKRIIDPMQPVKRDILFELYAKADPTQDTYAAVGFSETGRMQGLVSACIHSDKKGDKLNVINLRHSYNILNSYENVPVTIRSGIKNYGVQIEDGTFQCRWLVQTSVEFTFEHTNGTTVTTQADLGYKNFYIQLAQGSHDATTETKMHHTSRSSSKIPVSLAQTGTIKSFGSHILLKIHGSVMIVAWIGFVTISVMLARYYKNEWANQKLNDVALWFVLHRFMMLAAWLCSIIAVIFAYMYTETYHPGYHSISGTICLSLSTVQVLGGLLRPSQDSSKRILFNWAHFVCGNMSYLLAIFCIVTASFLPSIQLPPVYIWVVAMFVAFYALTHLMMTVHQFVVHKSSKISITPMGDLNLQRSSYADACGFVQDTYHKESNGFKQCMIGVLVTVVVIFIIVLVTLVNYN